MFQCLRQVKPLTKYHVEAAIAQLGCSSRVTDKWLLASDSSYLMAICCMSYTHAWAIPLILSWSSSIQSMIPQHPRSPQEVTIRGSPTGVANALFLALTMGWAERSTRLGVFRQMGGIGQLVLRPCEGHGRGYGWPPVLFQYTTTTLQSPWCYTFIQHDAMRRGSWCPTAEGGRLVLQ